MFYLKNNRITQLMDILEEVEGKAVIWAHYRHDIEKIVEAISKKYGEKTIVTYYGDTSTDDRQKAIDKIQDKNTNKSVLNPMLQKFKSCKYLGNFNDQ